MILTDERCNSFTLSPTHQGCSSSQKYAVVSIYKYYGYKRKQGRAIYTGLNGRRTDVKSLRVCGSQVPRYPEHSVCDVSGVCSQEGKGGFNKSRMEGSKWVFVCLFVNVQVKMTPLPIFVTIGIRLRSALFVFYFVCLLCLFFRLWELYRQLGF